ncbi:MAG TPA: ABC transporter permease, partial [Ignavibacteriaceae bacterium]|nr:ABC transporter permease [Ignavibacteriaceae bacterium]
MIYTLKILVGHPARLILTIGGIALCMILMLFLLGIYKGVADGSVDYIRENKADLWVLQHNATNILRGTSILTTFHGEIIKKCKDVESVSPVLLLLTSIKNSKGNSTIFLAGYNPSFSLGGPPKILEGRNVREDKEIVLDQSFAKKNKFNVEDKIEINNDTLTVVGISSGTNAFVIQYAFTTIKEAQSIIGFPNLVTCFLIKLKKGSSAGQTLQTLSKMLSGTVIYSHHEFLNNNIKEMESGFLPILYTVA